MEGGKYAMAENRIDVIDDFNYDSRNPQYNTDNRHWRRNTKAPYIYRYEGNPQERVYVDGHGISKRTVQAAERKSLTYVSEVMGVALLAYLVCELLAGTVLVWILQHLGVDVRQDFLSITMRGSQWGVTLVRIIAALVKYVVVFGFLQRGFRVPARLRTPVYAGGLPEYIVAIGGAMGIAAIYTIIDSMTGKGADLARQLFDYKDAAAVITYGLFDIIFLSLLSELLLRGILLPVLRQFGDRFAVFTLASAAFLFPNNIAERIGEFCIGLAASYLLIKSGSIEKCVILRIVYSALCYSRLVLLYSDEPKLTTDRFLLILIPSAMCCVFFYFLTRVRNRRLSNRNSHLETGKKVIVFTESVTMISWICISALLMLVQLIY